MSRLAPLSAALSVAALLAACGGADDPAAPPRTTSADELQVGGPRQVAPWRDPNAPRNASAPSGAHLTYRGGRVVSNLQVVQVLWGSGSYLSNVSSTSSPSIATFYQGVLNSTYVDWLSEYNANSQTIGRGSFAGQYTITPSTSATAISDATIQSELAGQINAGHLPAPTSDARGNNNTYYAVYFPHGKSITLGSLSSCVGFCAYHGTIASVGGHEIYYGVHPDMQAGSGCDVGCGGGTPFGNQTSVASHEMIETVTDPEVGLASVVGPPLAWYDSTNNSEIGDLCNAQQGSIVGSDGVSYVVQTEFSNTANDCIVSRAALPPLTANPAALSLSARGGLDNSRDVVITNNGPGTVSGIKLALSYVSGSTLTPISFGGIDTCTSASLAPGATCTVRLDFTSGCPKPSSTSWVLNVAGSGASVNVNLKGVSTGGVCL